jgi:hypothetical protein
MSAQDFGSQLPIIGGLLDDSQDNALDQLKKNQALYAGLQAPQFQDYNPVAYDPTMAQASTISEDPSLRGMQMNALNNLAGLSTTGLSAIDQQGFENARQMAGQIASSGNAAALQNAQARGVGGSGLEFAMREQANQDAAGRAQQASLQQAADSARQRALYNQAYGQMAGQVRGQDYNTNAANAGILNNFNMYNTNATNQARQYNVGQQNYAQQYNNDLRQKQYEDQLQKLGGMSGANSGMYKGYAAENAANNDQRNQNTQMIMDSVMGGA